MKCAYLNSQRMTLLQAAMVAAMMLGHSAAYGGPGAHGPNGEHLDAPSSAPAAGLARLPDGSVTISKLAQRRMEIRTLLAPASDASETFELPGRVTIDPNSGGRIQSTHGGRIESGPNGLPVVGRIVKKGAVLGYVRHHADPYADAAQRGQLAEITANRKILEQRVTRLESLEGTVPQKDIAAARIELASLVERERQTGGSLVSREALLAPVSGTIARADVVAGQVVDSKDVLFEIVDPSQLLVEATTANPAIGRKVKTAELLGVSGVTLVAVGVGQSMRDGLVPIIFRATKIAQSATPLAVGQPVTILAQSENRIRGIVLPAEAVVKNTANEPVVWIKLSAERYLPQPVRYQALDARSVVITNGLSADNRVVVQGASLIAQIR